MPREVLGMAIVNKASGDVAAATVRALTNKHKCAAGCPMCHGRAPPRLVSIEGISRAGLLCSLFNAATCDSTFPGSEAEMEPHNADGLLALGQTWFEQINGRPIYVDLAGTEVDVEPYERMNGHGLATVIIEGMRP